MNKLKELHLSGKAKIGLVILLLILLTSVLAPVLAPYDPLVSNLSEALQKPSAAHLLGTDNIGRDTLSRVLYGGRQSILLALAATVLSMLTSRLDADDRGGRTSWTGREEHADRDRDQFLGRIFQDRPR